MKLLLTTLSLCAMISLEAQSLREHYQAAIRAYESQDYKGYLQHNLSALEYHPSHPTILYNTASAYSLTGDTETACRRLSQLISYNADIDYAADDDLRGLIADRVCADQLQHVTDRYKMHRETSELYRSISADHHVEDIHMIDGALYFTDVHDGGVYRMTDDGTTELLTYLSGGAMAITSDEMGHLYVSSALVPPYSGHIDSAIISSIYMLDAKTGKQLWQLVLPSKEVIGSMIYSERYGLIASSSGTPLIYMIDTETPHIARQIPLSHAYNLQGVALSPSGDLLYVADYINGILRINLSDTADRVWLQSSELLLKGIDGLTAVDDHRLYGVQNGSTPRRLVAMTISGDAVTEIQLLDNALDHTGEPTNGKYYPALGYLYISNSQWPHYDKDGQPIQPQWETQQIRILR